MTYEYGSSTGSGEYYIENCNENYYDSSKCIPGPQQVKQLENDPYFTGNRKIMNDLLVDQVHYRTGPGFCNKEGRTEHNIWMRKTLIVWLRDVADHKGCEPDVLGLAVLLIDRYLNSCCIAINHYQLAGATCFFVASKVKETVPVLAERMVQYTDACITLEELLESEIQLLTILNFDTNGVSSTDFVLPIVDQLNVVHPARQALRYATLDVFIKCIHCVIICDFLPSYVAAACMLSACDSLYPNDDNFFKHVLSRLQSILSIDQDIIRQCYKCIQDCLAERASEEEPAETANPVADKIEEKSNTTNQTPTDLRDVRF